MRIEPAESQGSGIDDDVIANRRGETEPVVPSRRQGELGRESLVERYRVERVGEVVPPLDTGRDVERLAARLDVEKILHFLQAERRSDRHQLDDVQPRGGGEDLNGDNRAHAVGDEGDWRVRPGELIGQPPADRRTLFLV